MTRHRWTAKAAVRRSKTRIAAAIARLRDVAADWGDVDNAIVMEVDEAVAKLEELSTSIDEGIAERLAAGEEIGL